MPHYVSVKSRIPKRPFQTLYKLFPVDVLALAATLFALHVPDNMHLVQYFYKARCIVWIIHGLGHKAPLQTVPDHPFLPCTSFVVVKKTCLRNFRGLKIHVKEFLTSESCTHSQLMETCFTETD